MKPSEPQHQLSLRLSGEGKAYPRVSPKKNKARGKRIAIENPTLSIREKRFLPLVGVPATRADCPPPSVYCPYVRCRHHLALITADHRAGRPGLAHVPRDRMGRTISAPGDAGDCARSGTTVDPRWLELERRMKCWVERGEDGRMLNLHACYEGEADLFMARLHVGEPIDLLDGEVITGEETLPRIMGARLSITGNIMLDREPDGLFMFTLQRVRRVESCALNVADRGVNSNQEVGAALGRHRTLVAREVKRSGAKLREMGIDLRDVVKEEM